MRDKSRGFTLLEMVITIAILGILLTVAVPSLHQPLARYRLKSAGAQLASDLRWLRHQSIYGKAFVVNIVFDKYHNSYMIRDGAKAVVQRTLPPGIVMAELGLQQNPFSFTLSGAPSGGGGRIGLKNEYGERCYIHVMPSSGRIRVELERSSGGVRP